MALVRSLQASVVVGKTNDTARGIVRARPSKGHTDVRDETEQPAWWWRLLGPAWKPLVHDKDIAECLKVEPWWVAMGCGSESGVEAPQTTNEELNDQVERQGAGT